MLISKAALEAGQDRSRSTRCRSCWRGSASTYDAEAAAATPTSSFFERLTSVDLLHIDDLGAEKRSDWVLEQLYALVNERYESQRSMLVTTNLEHDASWRSRSGPAPSRG